MIHLNLDKSGPPENPVTQPSSVQAEPPVAETQPEAPNFITIQRKPWLLGDLVRVMIILLSAVVVAGLVLTILPQSTMDRMTKKLQARHGESRPDQVALLFLGDEAKENEFRIRGVVRNISTDQLEQLDTAVRLFSHDGTLLETAIVRMNKETIAPDEVAQFELVYPNYKNDIMKYSVEFKLRDGALVPYKDLRTTR
jgi:hypothetical protein